VHIDANSNADAKDNTNFAKLKFPSKEFLLNNTMPPPPLNTAIKDTVLLKEDDSKPVNYKQLLKLMGLFKQFLAMYVERFNVSQMAFAVLLEGFSLIESLNELADLLQDVGTLKRCMVA
jgi:hypothetical protein